MVELGCKILVGGFLEVLTFAATVNAIVCAETRAASTAFVAAVFVCAMVLDSDTERSPYD